MENINKQKSLPINKTDAMLLFIVKIEEKQQFQVKKWLI